MVKRILNNYRFLFILAVVLLIAANAFQYSLETFILLPRADDWRMIIIYIVPLLNEEFSFSRLWADFPHPLPIAGLMMTLSYYIDDLNFRYFPYLLFPFVIFKYIGLCIGYYLSRPHCVKQSSFDQYLCFILFALIVFSLNSGTHYYWWLVSVQYIYHFLALIFLLFVLMYLKTEHSKYLVLLFIQGFILLLSARVLGFPWLLAVCSVVGFRMLFVRHKQLLISMYVVLAIVLIFVLEQLFYLVMGIELHEENVIRVDQMMDIFMRWLDRKEEFIHFVVSSFASGFINFQWFTNELGWSQERLLVVNYVCFSLVLITMVICSIQIRNTAYLLPFIMLVFLFIMTLAAMFLRVDPQAHWTASYFPRYIAYKDFAPIAVIWVMLLIGHEKRYPSAKIFSVSCLAIIVLVLPIVTYKFSVYSWKYASSIKYSQQIDKQRLTFGYKWATDEGFRVSGKNVCEAFTESNEEKFSREFPCDLETGVWKWNALRFIGDNRLTSVFYSQISSGMN